jgi:hypothetical protein
VTVGADAAKGASIASLKSYDVAMRWGAPIMVALALALAGCGGAQESKKPDCPTDVTTPKSGAPIPSIDPSCLIGATGQKTPATEEDELWEGSFTYDFAGPTLTCDTRYSVRFTVHENRVSGETTVVTGSCPGAKPSDPIAGTKNGSTMTLSLFGGTEDMAITGDNRIYATFSSTPEEHRVLDVRCTNCDQ